MAQKKPMKTDAEIVIIRERGVNAKGYGHVAKRIMTDPAVSLSAKGIYGYLSSMAGSGESSFMRRSRLLEELNIGKRAYDTNMQQLESRGYITRAQSRATTGFWGTTVIEFVMIPACFAEEIYEAQNNETKPTMYSGTVYALGYGSVPRLVMQDPALTVKAKGLYAYFCAYAGPTDDAFPTRDKICFELRINKESYNNYKNELIQRKYLTAFQNHKDGKFTGTTFRINQFPNQVETLSSKAIVISSSKTSFNASCTENGTTVEPCTENSTTVAPCTENECTVAQCTENECTENSTTLLINNNTPTTNISSKNNILLDRLIEMVREKIHYEILMFSYMNELAGIDAINVLVEGIVEVLSSSLSRITIGRETYLTKHVQGVLMEISNEAVVNVIERYLAHADKVDNAKAYLLASIYKELICPTEKEEDAS